MLLVVVRPVEMWKKALSGQKREGLPVISLDTSTPILSKELAHHLVSDVGTTLQQIDVGRDREPPRTRRYDLGGSRGRTELRLQVDPEVQFFAAGFGPRAGSWKFKVNV